MRRVFFLLAGLVGTLPGQIRFEEIGEKAGLTFQLKNGSQRRFRQVELMVGGVAVLDYDNDECQDVFFTNGAMLPSLKKVTAEYHNRLYRNNCDLTFADVTEKTGVAGEGYSMAAATADYDNDGDADIFVAGVNRNALLRNRGDGTFEDATVTAKLSGVDPKLGKLWAISAGWFDYNNDGHLDLFVSNYVKWDPQTEPRCGTAETPLYCHPDNYRGLPNQLFRNNGDGTFVDATYESGVGKHIGKGMGVAFADFNRDGYMDVFVANDSVRSFLFENKGNGKFDELGLEYGVGLREDGAAIAGMGADARDFDNDGLPDVFLTGMINDTFLLFRNLGKGLPFADHSVLAGTTVATRQLTGWSAGIYDFDNDGWKDIFCATSHFPNLGRYLNTDSRLPNALLRNAGQGKFSDVSKFAGPEFQKAGFHHGAAFGDFDNDGRVDAVVSVLNGPARLFRNVTEPRKHWLALKLIGTKSNKDGLGAEVTVTLGDGKQQLHNFATTSVGYASSSEPVVRFGLGDFDTAKAVVIKWPGQASQTLTDVKADQLLKITQP